MKGHDTIESAHTARSEKEISVQKEIPQLPDTVRDAEPVERTKSFDVGLGEGTRFHRTIPELSHAVRAPGARKPPVPTPAENINNQALLQPSRLRSTTEQGTSIEEDITTGLEGLHLGISDERSSKTLRANLMPTDTQSSSALVLSSEPASAMLAPSRTRTAAEKLVGQPATSELSRLLPEPAVPLPDPSSAYISPEPFEEQAIPCSPLSLSVPDPAETGRPQENPEFKYIENLRQLLQTKSMGISKRPQDMHDQIRSYDDLNGLRCDRCPWLDLGSINHLPRGSLGSAGRCILCNKTMPLFLLAVWKPGAPDKSHSRSVMFTSRFAYRIVHVCKHCSPTFEAVLDTGPSEYQVPSDMIRRFRARMPEHDELPIHYLWQCQFCYVWQHKCRPRMEFPSAERYGSWRARSERGIPPTCGKACYQAYKKIIRLKSSSQVHFLPPSKPLPQNIWTSAPSLLLQSLSLDKKELSKRLKPQINNYENRVDELERLYGNTDCQGADNVILPPAASEAEEEEAFSDNLPPSDTEAEAGWIQTNEDSLEDARTDSEDEHPRQPQRKNKRRRRCVQYTRRQNQGGDLAAELTAYRAWRPMADRVIPPEDITTLSATLLQLFENDCDCSM